MNINLSRILLLVVYGGTGITALAYEVLWTRMLSLMFGISIFGVVLTVAAFMAGLGAGSLLAAGRFHRYSSKQALMLLALLEGIVAIYALLLPVCMPWIDQALLAVGQGLSLHAWQGMQSLALLLLLFPAAMAMGFAFPMALRAAEGIGLSLASMYGMNAMGGACGAVLPLLLLPLFGWQTGLWSVAALGLCLAALAAGLGACQKDAALLTQPVKGPRPAWADLLAYAGVGAAALMLEIIWTREFGMVLLRTEYVLAVLLLVYLLGIGMGSIIARRISPSRWLGLLPVGAAMLAVGAQYLVPGISQWANRAEFSSLAQAMLAEGGVVLLCTLPVTLALGAWLPLLARRFDGDSQHVTGGVASGGWWYGANSVGAAIGVLLSGFVVLPWLGAAGALIVAVLLLLLCGLRWADRGRLWLISVPLLLLFAWPVSSLPPATQLLPSLAGGQDVSLYEDAVAVTHVVEQANGQRLLLSDLQRMDASSEPTAVTVQKNQARLPLLLHQNPQSLLLLGLGTGITAAGSLPYAGLKRTAVELSQGAINAARDLFAEVNGGVVEQMTIVRDDARRYLRTDTHHYDVIIGDLFHPDMVGRANLLSLQQFTRARERLNKGGVFVQWLALNQFDVASLQVVLQTFRHAFRAHASDHAMLFVDGYRVALVGMRHMPQAGELLAWLERMGVRQRQEATGGEGFWTWLGRYWGEIPDFSQSSVRLQDEWAPVIEFALPRVRYSGGVDALAMWRWLLSWREDDQRAARVWAIGADDRETFKRAWASVGIDVRLWMAELSGDEQQVINWARLSRKANPQDRWPAFALADRMFASLQHGLPDGLSKRRALERILELRPDHEGAIRAMLSLARNTGDKAQVDHWRLQLKKVSPLAIDVRGR